MKKDWTYKKLGEVATAKIRDLLWFQEGPGVRKNQYTEDGVKLLNVANLVNGTVDLSTSSRYISEEEAYGKYKHFLVDEGDLIIASSGIQVSYFDKKMGFVTADQLPLCMNTSTIRFKVLDNSITDIKYFMYYLKSYSFKRQLAKYITGAAQLNFGPSHLKQMSMPLYPLAIQHSIVAELDLLHSVISKKKELLRELDNLAQSLFYQMFGDPITNPMGWEIKKIGEVAETTSGGTPSKSNNEYYENGTIPWLRSGEVSQGYIYSTELFITQKGFDNSSAKMIPVDSVAIAMYGATVGEVGIIKSPMCTNQAICSILPNKYLVPIYLRYFLMAMKPKYIAVAAGGAQPNISQAIIRNTHLPIPPLSLQQSFAAKVSAIEAQKQAIAQSIKENEALLVQRMDTYFS